MASMQPRSEPITKASNLRSIVASRVDKQSFFQPVQPSMSGLFIIGQFRIHRDNQAGSFTPIENEDDEDIKRRILYIREQKFGAISYATTT